MSQTNKQAPPSFRLVLFKSYPCCPPLFLWRLTPCIRWAWWRQTRTLSSSGRPWRCSLKKSSASSSSSPATRSAYRSPAPARTGGPTPHMFPLTPWRSPLLMELQVMADKVLTAPWSVTKGAICEWRLSSAETTDSDGQSSSSCLEHVDIAWLCL